MTYKQILQEVEEKVLSDREISASQWVEYAMKINVLKGSMDNFLACYEADFADRMTKFIEEGKSATIAEKLSKCGDDYKRYLILKGELKRIDEFIRLAKRRATIQEY